MEESHEPQQHATRRGASPAYLVVAVFLAVALAGGGFFVGRASVTPPQISDQASSACDDATSAMQEHLKAVDEASVNASTTPSQADKQNAELKQAAVIVSQNPTCFSANDRAVAQTFLDNEEQQAAQSAAQCAGAQNSLERSIYC